MSAMIQRVAKVLARSGGIQDCDRELDGVPLWRTYEGDACAAIEAMREPTAEMAEEGRYWCDINDAGATRTWQAMIDTALISSNQTNKVTPEAAA